MNRQRRFHIIFAVHYLRYGLLLCLVPMLQALLAFDLDSLWAALRQDAVILLACAAAALALWRATAFRLEDGAVKVTQGVFYRSYHTFGRASIAALEIARPLYCRMLGASRITLYFKTNASPKSYSMFLHKKDAAAVADVLLPVRSDTSVFEPTGFERLSFVMLSANIITSSAFALWGVKQLDEVLGQNFQQIALDTFHEAELFAARYLPTGLAFLVTLGFAVTGFTFLYALLHTAGFKVCRNGGVIISKGGFVTLIERRILVACVSACDVCVTPPARLLRRYPVYLSAGSFRGGDLPVLVYKKGEERTVERLLPNFCPPDGPLCMPARKSPVQYLWQPGTLLNTIGDLAAAANHTLAKMGFAPHTEEEYKYMVGNGIPKLIERFLPPGHRDEAAQAQAARLFFPYYDAHKEDATAPYPGIPALLAALHGAGVKLGVVSNKEDALTKSVVSHYFPGLFDAVAGHTLGTPTKPDPHLVNGMRAAFGLSAQQVLYVGDSGVDIETARNAGLAGCGVLWGFRTGDELCGAGASYLARSPEDIRVLVLDA